MYSNTAYQTDRDTREIERTRPSSTLLISLGVIAFLIRLLAFAISEDKGGDGAARLLWTYAWSKSPHFITHHVWLPGWVYFTGVINLLIDNPIISCRVTNVLLGSLTIPTFYICILKVYCHKIAIISAIILTFLPLHIALSVSSLTEIYFLFTTIAGILFFLMALESDGSIRVFYLILFSLCLSLSAMTRYEAWVLLPLFPIYFFVNTKHVLGSICLCIVLSLFPVSWMTGSYLATGHLIPAYQAVMNEGYPTHIADALHTLAILMWGVLGWLLGGTALWGLGLTVWATRKRRLNLNQALHVAIFGITALFMVKFVMDRGTAIHSRYCLLMFVMMMPFAALTLTRYLPFRRLPMAASVIVSLIALGIAHQRYWPELYIIPRAPYAFLMSVVKPTKRSTYNWSIEVKRLAQWLKRSPYRHDAILLTNLWGYAWYLPLYDPDLSPSGQLPNVSSQYMIIGNWQDETGLRNFISNQRPSLLVTHKRDKLDQLRVENLTGKTLQDTELIHTEGKLQVYLLGR